MRIPSWTEIVRALFVARPAEHPASEWPWPDEEPPTQRAPSTVAPTIPAPPPSSFDVEVLEHDDAAPTLPEAGRC